MQINQGLKDIFPFQPIDFLNLPVHWLELFSNLFMSIETIMKLMKHAHFI